MPSFIDWFVSLDAYGEPITVTYKGDSTYKTNVGAFLTVCMKAFMLFFTLEGIFALLDYQNPQINQYRIFDERNDGREVNLGESLGYPMFGAFSNLKSDFVEVDPSIAEFKVDVIQFDWNSTTPLNPVIVKELEITSITPETHPDYFKGWAAKYTINLNYLYGIKNPNDVTFINDYSEVTKNQFLRLRFAKC